jgi:hypothetical protein
MLSIEANPHDVACVLAYQAGDRSGVLQILRSGFSPALSRSIPAGSASCGTRTSI